MKKKTNREDFVKDAKFIYFVSALLKFPCVPDAEPDPRAQFSTKKRSWHTIEGLNTARAFNDSQWKKKKKTKKKRTTKRESLIHSIIERERILESLRSKM